YGRSRDRIHRTYQVIKWQRRLGGRQYIALESLTTQFRTQVVFESLREKFRADCLKSIPLMQLPVGIVNRGIEHARSHHPPDFPDRPPQPAPNFPRACAKLRLQADIQLLRLAPRLV